MAPTLPYRVHRGGPGVFYVQDTATHELMGLPFKTRTWAQRAVDDRNEIRRPIDSPELADQLGPVLEAAGPDGLTPSAAGRAAGLTTGQAHQGLTWMVANQFARTTGNGAHTHYHPR